MVSKILLYLKLDSYYNICAVLSGRAWCTLLLIYLKMQFYFFHKLSSPFFCSICVLLVENRHFIWIKTLTCLNHLTVKWVLFNQNFLGVYSILISYRPNDTATVGFNQWSFMTRQFWGLKFHPNYEVRFSFRSKPSESKTANLVYTSHKFIAIWKLQWLMQMLQFMAHRLKLDPWKAR